MRNKSAFTLVEVLIVIVIIGLLAAMAIPAYDRFRTGDSRAKREYTAWCKLTGRTDITREEWITLRRAGLLRAAYVQGGSDRVEK